MNPIQNLLKQFNHALGLLELPDGPKELYDPIKYTLDNGGKRMRPLLVLLGCKVFSEDVSQVLKPAMGIELFHNFTLLHDDIMDEAPLRRGNPSVYKKWNSNIAILSGDAMIIKAYQLLVETRKDALSDVLIEFNRTALEVCEGQQLDMNFESRDDVSLDEYLQMIGLKTAVLLATSLKIGAIIGGANSEQANLLYNFGLNTGIAFQLQDDILDVYGESAKVGKQKGGDIISNKKTFLLLKALDLANQEKSLELNVWLQSNASTEKVAAVTAIYNQLGVRQLAEEKMWDYYNSGIASLEKVNGNAAWVTTLKQFSNDLMHREH